MDDDARLAESERQELEKVRAKLSLAQRQEVERHCETLREHEAYTAKAEIAIARVIAVEQAAVHKAGDIAKIITQARNESSQREVKEAAKAARNKALPDGVESAPEYRPEAVKAEESAMPPVGKDNELPLRLDGTPYVMGESITSTMDTSNYRWRDAPPEPTQEPLPTGPLPFGPKSGPATAHEEKTSSTQTIEAVATTNSRGVGMANFASGAYRQPAPAPSHDPAHGPMSADAVLNRFGNPEAERRYETEKKQTQEKDNSTPTSETVATASSRGVGMANFVSEATKKAVEDRKAEWSLARANTFGRTR